jgi:hypothetical protein
LIDVAEVVALTSDLLLRLAAVAPVVVLRSAVLDGATRNNETSVVLEVGVRGGVAVESSVTCGRSDVTCWSTHAPVGDGALSSSC